MFKREKDQFGEVSAVHGADIEAEVLGLDLEDAIDQIIRQNRRLFQHLS